MDVALGLAITLIFGASALNALSTNAIFNIFFFLMLVVFAASFFGAFEITLPSKWSNAVDSKAEATTGLLSIFLMAFTLSLWRLRFRWFLSLAQVPSLAFYWWKYLLRAALSLRHWVCWVLPLHLPCRSRYSPCFPLGSSRCRSRAAG